MSVYGPYHSCATYLCLVHGHKAESAHIAFAYTLAVRGNR